MIDVIVLLTILFFAFAGLRRGFWQYLLELLITALSLGASWCYYQQKHEILKSLLVFVCVFLGLSLLKWLLLSTKRKEAAQKPSFSFANRFLGAILGFAWGTLIAAMLILATELLPVDTVFNHNIKEELRASRACQILQRLIRIKEIAIVENISYMSKVRLDEKAKRKLMEQPKIQELLQRDCLKAIMEDPETASQLENKDFKNLLTNPKILKLLNDGQFVEELMKLDFKKALEEEN